MGCGGELGNCIFGVFDEDGNFVEIKGVSELRVSVAAGESWIRLPEIETTQQDSELAKAFLFNCGLWVEQGENA